MTSSIENEGKTNRMTKNQLKILGMPSIASQLPVRFDNGYILENFEGRCCNCETPIKPDSLHGSVVQQIQSTATIEAVGLCDRCKIAVPFIMRVRDDGTTDTCDALGNWSHGLANRRRPFPDLMAKMVIVLIIASLAGGLFYAAQHVKR